MPNLAPAGAVHFPPAWPAHHCPIPDAGAAFAQTLAAVRNLAELVDRPSAEQAHSGSADVALDLSTRGTQHSAKPVGDVPSRQVSSAPAEAILDLRQWRPMPRLLPIAEIQPQRQAEPPEAGHSSACAPEPSRAQQHGKPTLSKVQQVALQWHTMPADQRKAQNWTEYCRQAAVPVSSVARYVKADGALYRDLGGHRANYVPRRLSVAKGLALLWHTMTPDQRNAQYLSEYCRRGGVPMQSVANYVDFNGELTPYGRRALLDKAGHTS
jgi:hypothetical protein